MLVSTQNVITKIVHSASSTRRRQEPPPMVVGFDDAGEPVFAYYSVQQSQAHRLQKMLNWTKEDLDDSTKPLPSCYLLQQHYKLNLDLGPIVNNFIDDPIPDGSPGSQVILSKADKELLSLFRALESKGKELADSTNELKDVAKRLTKFLSSSGQLFGWGVLEEYVFNNLSAEELKKLEESRKDDTIATLTIDTLMDIAKRLLYHTMIRTKWVSEIIKQRFEVCDIFRALQRDKEWMEGMDLFLKRAEKSVQAIINASPQTFAKFRELQSRGVTWPHAPNLRRCIERAGFVFRPMMIKRDRCVCDSCGVEVSGWRIWQNPWFSHDWTKRHPFAPPPGTRYSRSYAPQTSSRVG